MNTETDNILKIIESKGYYDSDKILSTDDLEELQNMVNLKIQKYGKKNLWLNEKLLKGTYASNDIFKAKILKIFQDICNQLDIKDYNKHEAYKVLRVISGSKQKKESHKYHFDAHLLTMVVPIFIPNRDNSGNGDLIIYPNLRKITNNIFKNILQKLFFQNSIFRIILSKNFFKRLFNYQRLILKPGSIYIFYGFRTLHGNLEINENDVRATLLLHFYDVFQDSQLVKYNRSRRIKKENKNITNKIKV